MLCGCGPSSSPTWRTLSRGAASAAPSLLARRGLLVERPQPQQYHPPPPSGRAAGGAPLAYAYAAELQMGGRAGGKKPLGRATSLDLRGNVVRLEVPRSYVYQPFTAKQFL